MAKRNTTYAKETRKRISLMRGKYKHLPLMETLKEMKREEKGRLSQPG